MNRPVELLEIVVLSAAFLVPMSRLRFIQHSYRGRAARRARCLTAAIEPIKQANISLRIRAREGARRALWGRPRTKGPWLTRMMRPSGRPPPRPHAPPIAPSTPSPAAHYSTQEPARQKPAPNPPTGRRAPLFPPKLPSAQSSTPPSLAAPPRSMPRSHTARPSTCAPPIALRRKTRPQELSKPA